MDMKMRNAFNEPAKRLKMPSANTKTLVERIWNCMSLFVCVGVSVVLGVCAKKKQVLLI